MSVDTKNAEPKNKSQKNGWATVEDLNYSKNGPRDLENKKPKPLHMHYLVFVSLVLKILFFRSETCAAPVKIILSKSPKFSMYEWIKL